MRKLYLFPLILTILLVSIFGIAPLISLQYVEPGEYTLNVLSMDKDNVVYLGGQVIGISINTDGLVITSKVNVITKNGTLCPFKDVQLSQGDVLYSIDGERLDEIKDVDSLIQNKDSVQVTIKSGPEFSNYIISPAVDIISNRNKIGLMIQDKISGIGTITYIDPKNNTYAALGHPIKDCLGYSILNGKGKIYKANVINVEKGTVGKAGELNGTFCNIGNNLGDITTSSDFGIFGSIDVSNLDLKTIEVGNQNDVKVGPAQILTTIDGFNSEYFDIEIIKTYKQSSKNEKSMVIKVTDQKLLESTGGIVQGMSGSPIMQNGKLVGAVTHVFLSDSSKGYGIYLDWMKN